MLDRQKETIHETAKDQMDALEKLAAPIVEWIRENHDPHTEVHISWDHVWVRRDLLSVPFPYSEEHEPVYYADATAESRRRKYSKI